MRKIVLLAAVAAMVLAVAAPALAQASAVGGSVQYVDCDQIQAAATGQYNVANDQDLAAIAQNLGVDENQVLACYGSIAAGNDVNIDGGDGTAMVTATATATATAAAGSDQYGGSASAAAGGELPDTGGASLLALGAGALLVAGGLLARRFVR